MGIDAQILVKNYGAKLNEDEIRKIGIRIYECFSNIVWFPSDNKHCIEEVNEYYQDGDSITPQKDEQLLEVHLGCRYYGIGYERGPILDIINLCKLLKILIPGGKAFYGGDSSGVCAEEFGEREQQNLIHHYFYCGHTPYRKGFSGIFEKNYIPTCPRCKIQMYSNGGGGNKTFWNCSGCDRQVITIGTTEYVTPFYKSNIEYSSELDKKL